MVEAGTTNIAGFFGQISQSYFELTIRKLPIRCSQASLELFSFAFGPQIVDLRISVADQVFGNCNPLRAFSSGRAFLGAIRGFLAHLPIIGLHKRVATKYTL